MFKCFGDTKEVGKDIRIFFEKFCIEDVDDLRWMYYDDSKKGPEVEDMIFFLSCCPKLKRRRHTKNLYKM